MAKTGMERLRYASQQSKQENCSICVAAEVDNLCDAKCNDVRGIALRAICKQIEDEHTAELKEARDAPKKLDIEGYGEGMQRQLKLNAAADWVEDNGGLDAVRERMRLYTDMLNRIDSTVSGDEQTCFDSTTPMGEATDLFDAIFAELDKRLMPQGMEWPPKDSAGEDLHIGDKAHFLRTEHDGDHEWDDVITAFRYQGVGGDVWIVESENGEAFACECMNMPPEPDVLGADGLPIKVGETVYIASSPNDPQDETVWAHGGALEVVKPNEYRQGMFICRNDLGSTIDACADALTHTPPDTRATLAGEMGEELAYIRANGGFKHHKAAKGGDAS